MDRIIVRPGIPFDFPFRFRVALRQAVVNDAGELPDRLRHQLPRAPAVASYFLRHALRRQEAVI